MFKSSYHFWGHLSCGQKPGHSVGPHGYTQNAKQLWGPGVGDQAAEDPSVSQRLWSQMHPQARLALLGKSWGLQPCTMRPLSCLPTQLFSLTWWVPGLQQITAQGLSSVQN